MEMRRAGKFQKVVGRARSLWFFTRAGERAPYLVREIVQNDAYYLQRVCWSGQNAPRRGKLAVFWARRYFSVSVRDALRNFSLLWFFALFKPLMNKLV
jgi:hypothetical protein